MPRTVESAADREKRLRRSQAQFGTGVVDMGLGDVEMGPVTIETNRRPDGATEVSRADFDRRRRPVVSGIDDVEIGDARVEPSPSPLSESLHSQDPEAIAARTISQLEAQAPATQARGDQRRGQLEATIDRDRRRSAAYDRSLMDGLVMDSDNLEGLRAGTVQGVTLGFGDEIAGASRQPWDMQAQPRGFGRPERATYASERDRARAENEAARAAAPRSYAGGEVLGSALPALALPGATARTAIGRIGQAGLMGGAFGGASGLGHARGTASQQAREALEGAGYGAVGGAGMQAVGEGFGAASRYLRSAPEGTPAPGGDFTPEQRARIQADPELDTDMLRRERLERQAANRRVETAHPNATDADLARIDETYEGGTHGLARDMDAAGISPRRSMPSAETVQRRAIQAGRAPVVDMEPPLPAMSPPPMPDEALPVGTRAGQFADDEGVRMTAPSGRSISSRGRFDDLPADPADAHPFDPAMTEEAKADRIRAELAQRTQTRVAERNATMTDAERAAAEEATPRPVRPERPIRFNEGMMAGDVPSTGRPARFADEAEPVIASRGTALPARRPAVVDMGDEPIDFGMDVDAGQPAGVRDPLDDGGALRQQNNILSAERRAGRGSTSRATHEDRTWPIRAADFIDAPPEAGVPPQDWRGRPRPEDITPQAAPPRAPAQPPPLPRRATPQRTEPDLGRWDAPSSTSEAPTPPAPRQTPGQRAAPAVRDLAEQAERSASTRGGPTDPRGVTVRLAQDFVRDNFLRGAQATGNEMRSDAIARDIVRRLNDNPATRSYGEQLWRIHQTSAPRSFGLALQTLMTRYPDVAQAVEHEATPAFHPDGTPNYGIIPGVEYAPTPGATRVPQEDPGAADWGTVPGVEYAPTQRQRR